MTSHKCKFPDVRRSRRDQIWTCGCGKEYRPVRYTCPCGTFGCRDAWEWVGMVESPAQAEPIEAEVEIEAEDDAAE